MKAILISLLTLCLPALAQIPSDCKQVIVGIAPTWNSSHVTLSVFERNNHNSPWQLQGSGWPGRLGKNGLSWGLGLHNTSQVVQHSPHKTIKKEGDGRAPSGIFHIGSAFGYAAHIQKHPTLTYRQITTRDLWVEDSKSIHYNRHLVIPHEPKSTWEKKAQMRQNDHAHSLKLFIGHNDKNETGKAKPYAGSAIFFHIWRGGGTKATAGCTTMEPTKLQSLIAKVDPTKKPVYVLLTKTDYTKFRTPWKLP